MTEIPDTSTAAIDTPPSQPALDLFNPENFINRELSWLAFNRRVLEEAQDPNHPLLERVKFIAIFGSNLDEFFMTRVAGLKEQIAAGVTDTPPDGMTPQEQLSAIRKTLHPLLKEVRTTLRRRLMPQLRKEGIVIHNFSRLNVTQTRRANRFFQEHIFPVLTPLAFDPGRPFPHISNLSLNLAVRVRSPEFGEHFARIKVPASIPRFVPVPPNGRKMTVDRFHFVWVEQLIIANLPMLFPGMEVVEAYPFRVTRNADIEIQEDEASDLLETVENVVRRRRFGPVVRLTIDQSMPSHVRDLLVRNLQHDPRDVFPTTGMVGLSDLLGLYKVVKRAELKYSRYIPRVPAALQTLSEPGQIFSVIRRGDILLHHPYDSFTPVVDFIRAAARDPQVLAIKQTLYRVGRNSPVVDALMEARENDKEVAVLVELKARFDEESNIGWARALERTGVHVVYGLLGLKTHAKVTLVVRREHDGVRRYLHLSTGNYNSVTANIYTDVGLFTCDDKLADGISNLFNRLTGYADQQQYSPLMVAPIDMRERFATLIEREIERHSPDNPGRIVMKMNALGDDEMIRRLYKASQAGVQVDLLVRGVCCLRPGVPGLSDNIRVISIVGRFLEHSRVFYFYNGGQEEVYIGSGDLMPRSLNGRVEVILPILDPDLRVELKENLLRSCMTDNTQARLLMSDGAYVRLSPGENEPFSCQEAAMRGQTSPVTGL